MDERVFETTIILDEEKIKESPYSETYIFQYLENVFSAVDMVREENTFKNGTCALVGVAICALLKAEWFVKLLKDWTLSIREDDVITYTEKVLESKAVRKKYLDKYGITYEGNGEEG